MVVPLALISIVGGLAACAILVPWLGWLGLSAVPFVASLATAGLALALAARAPRSVDREWTHDPCRDLSDPAVGVGAGFGGPDANDAAAGDATRVDAMRTDAMRTDAMAAALRRLAAAGRGSARPGMIAGAGEAVDGTGDDAATDCVDARAPAPARRAG